MEAVNILIEALPYIKKFHKKKIMIKYGGHAIIDAQAKSSTARDTVLLKYVGHETHSSAWWRSRNFSFNE